MSAGNGTARPKIVLIGAGSMGSLHARVISQNERCDLVRIVDPMPDGATALAERYDVRWTPEIGSLADADAVVIAASTEFHYELAMAVLAQEKPLLVEKPVCDGLAESEEVVETAAQRGIPLMCGLLERYNPAVLTALSLVDNPVHINATRHSPYAPRIVTGVGWDLLVHDVDLAIRALGGEQPVTVQGNLGHFHPNSVTDAEDVVETVLGFPGGRLATISASRIGQRKIRSLVISEVDRLIEADLLRRDVIIYRHVSNDAATPDGRGYRQQTVMEIPELLTAREPLATQLDHFLDLIDGQVGMDEERESILPSHRVIATVLNNTRTPVG